MATSKIYAMTSLNEAFPFVIIEAMQSGLPVVAFDVRVGPRSLITPGKDGFLIKDGDIAAFAERLEYLMNNTSIREKMSEQAYIDSLRYTKDEVIKKWIEILKIK